eukprot:4050218-Pyramimonas_sp.AAC.1
MARWPDTHVPLHLQRATCPRSRRRIGSRMRGGRQRNNCNAKLFWKFDVRQRSGDGLKMLRLR